MIGIILNHGLEGVLKLRLWTVWKQGRSFDDWGNRDCRWKEVKEWPLLDRPWETIEVAIGVFAQLDRYKSGRQLTSWRGY